MPTVDLVYDPSCPNVTIARANLMRAFAAAGIAARWQEHRIGDEDAPLRTRGYGSPTILVDGRDAAGEPAHAEISCRIYAGSGGAPSVDTIARALSASASSMAAASVPDQQPASRHQPSQPGASAAPRWRSSATVMPAIAVAFMPKVVCPFCWPAYVGALGAMGLGFLMEDAWLFPLSALLLGLAVGTLAWRASARRGRGPVIAGSVAAAAILVGKFALGSSAFTYAGVGLLALACIWNAWPRRAARSDCPACVGSRAGR